MYEYKAFVTHIVDSDTFDADCYLGFNVVVKLRFRLDGIDTPETFRPSCNEEKELGSLATKRTSGLILNKEVILKSKKIEIYGRWGATVTLQDGRDLATILISEGFTKKKEWTKK